MLTLFRPFNELARWHREFDRTLATRNGESRFFAPAVDVEENEDHIVIRADLPGVDEKDIEVSYHDGRLVLSGKREEASEKTTESTVYRERRTGSFCRTFRVGPDLDPEKIEASYKQGVLTVTVGRKEETKPRQIPVATN